MITYFRHLLFDEKMFLGFMRGLVQALSVLFLTDKIDFNLLPEYLTTIIPALGVFLGGFIRSSGSSGNQIDRKK